MNISLVILAYNEEKFIKDVVSKYINYFDEVIVVNDNSRDETKNIIQNLEKNYENLTLINNTKNFGAGKSLEIGINHFLKSKNDYLIKIDGDDQFSFQDVIFLKDIIQKEHFDFIKCDRFWHDGIIGKIPTIRYLGNSFASFLISSAFNHLEFNNLTSFDARVVLPAPGKPIIRIFIYQLDTMVNSKKKQFNIKKIWLKFRFTNSLLIKIREKCQI